MPKPPSPIWLKRGQGGFDKWQLIYIMHLKHIKWYNSQCQSPEGMLSPCHHRAWPVFSDYFNKAELCEYRDK